MPIKNLSRFFEKSILFDVQLPQPPDQNVFNDPHPLLSPSVDEGYYLFVTPLTPGEHTIAWTASATDCEFVHNNYAQDNEYELTIAPR